MSRIILTLLFAGTVALLPFSRSAAATYRLESDGTGDFATIQAAILAASNGDTISRNGNICADPLFCYLENLELYLSDNSPCAPSANPECGLIGAWTTGCTSSVPPVFAGPAITAFPNPFRDRVTLRPASGSSGSAVVYDVRGALVRRLSGLATEPGAIVWDGRDEAGGRVANGRYLVVLRSGSGVFSTGVTLVR